MAGVVSIWMGLGGRLVTAIKGSEMPLVEIVRGRHVKYDMEGTDLVLTRVGRGIVRSGSGPDVTVRL